MPSIPSIPCLWAVLCQVFPNFTTIPGAKPVSDKILDKNGAGRVLFACVYFVRLMDDYFFRPDHFPENSLKQKLVLSVKECLASKCVFHQLASFIEGHHPT